MLTLNGHTGPVWALAYSPDGSLLASGGADRTLRLWDVAQRRERAILPGLLNTVCGVAFAPDGRTVASVTLDRQLRLWDVATRRCWPVGPRQGLDFTSVAFFSHGRALATGAGVITCLAISPDGLVAAGSGYTQFDRGAVKVWDVAWDSVPVVLEVSDVGHWSVLFTGERRRVDLGGGIRVVQLWRPEEERRLPDLPHRHPVAAVAFSPDGATLASAAERTITLWDPVTGQERRRWKGHAREVGALAFTPDGSTLLSGGIDRTVRLWDATSGRLRRSYAWPTGKVYAVAVAPDGLTAAAAGTGSEIVIWDLESR
jgi:WD40 repeat protein